MIGYVCKYTPVEILEAMNADPVMIEPVVSNFETADSVLHPNICSYVKGVLEAYETGGYDGIVLVTCCDSVRRLYDILKEKHPNHFIYLLDVPRKTNSMAVELFGRRISDMAEAYRAYSGNTVDFTRIRELIKSHEQKNSDVSGLQIGLVGGRVSESFRRLLREFGIRPAVDMTCTSMRKRLWDEASKLPEISDDKTFFNDYGACLLKQLPCLRMADTSARTEYLNNAVQSMDGIIYHTVKFCDSYAYEFASISSHKGMTRILKLDTDLTPQSEGQVRTRLGAFLEALGEHQGKSLPNRRGVEDKSLYVLGIDSGSTSTNGVLMNENHEIIAEAVIRTGAKTISSAERILRIILEKSHLDRADISRIAATGYGRVSIPFADQDITEISCHAKGAVYFDPSVRTILDIGGQDSKAISLNDAGEVVDFVMNDKCAAGTGRFLEMMARTLELEVSELGEISEHSTEVIEISSMCTVFAESEVISLIAQNKEKADIVRGIHMAIAGKAVSLLNRVGIKPVLMMTGGVALNPGVVKAVEEKTGQHVVICKDPEIVGAAGAALFGCESLTQKSACDMIG